MENNFEKKVRTKLAEMRIDPSPGVWKNVEKKLNKNTRRRPVFWWILLPAAVVSGIYFFYPLSREKQGKPAVVADGRQITNYLKNKARHGSPGSTHSIKPEQIKAYRNIQKPKSIEITESFQKRIPSVTANKNIAVSSLQITPAAPAEKIPISFPGIIHLPNDMTTTPDLTAKSLKTSTVTPKGNGRTITRQLRAEKWKLNFNFLPGISFATDRLLWRPDPTQQYSNPSMDPGSIPSSGPTPPAVLASRPGARSGIGLKFELQLSRMVSNHSSLSAGLGYAKFSIAQTSRYYSAASATAYSQNYSANFHFIELPITYHRQETVIGIATDWQAGIVVSDLISADALQYENYSLYKDNSMLNRLQTGIFAAVSFKLVKTPHFDFNGGPFYQYHLSRMAHDGILQNKHLNSAGIKTELSFKLNNRSNVSTSTGVNP